jgi:hypothetical protein
MTKQREALERIESLVRNQVISNEGDGFAAKVEVDAKG